MSAALPKTDFLAVLIFDDGNGRYTEAPQVFSASHPEIAFQLALAAAGVPRYGRKFVGISHLQLATGGEAPIACSRKGDAEGFVCPKEQLAAFLDSRWAGVECDPDELAEALKEPPLLCELKGLDEIQWNALSHAYGDASDVPVDLSRLASFDAKFREAALWQLFGSIYHQGDIFQATAFAIPFLMQLATNAQLPNRQEICNLLKAISEGCTGSPDAIRKGWETRAKMFGEIFAKPSTEMAERDIANRIAVKESLIKHVSDLRSLSRDENPGIASHARAILTNLELIPTN